MVVEEANIVVAWDFSAGIWSVIKIPCKHYL